MQSINELPKHHLVPRISARELQADITRMAGVVGEKYAGEEIALLAIFLGAKWFRGELINELRSCPKKPLLIRQDSMRASSYANSGGMESNRNPQIVDHPKNPEASIFDKHVLLIEDIIDTGQTIRDTVLPYVWSFSPKSIEVVSMLTKFERLEVNRNDLHLLASGPDIRFFAVGSGLDWLQYYRNLPGIQEVILEN